MGENDRELLKSIDEIVLSGAAGEHEAGTLPDLVARIVRAAPRPGDHFREQLLARLQGELAAQGEAIHAARATHLSEVAVTSTSTAQGAISSRRIALPVGTLSRLLAGKMGRYASLAVGLAVMAVVFVGMASMFNQRIKVSKGSQGNQTPTGAASGVLTATIDASTLISGLKPSQLLNTGPISQMAWSLDGNTLATFGGTDLELWDTKTGKSRRSIYASEAYGLAWSPDGNVLAVGYDVNKVKLIDVNTGGELRTMSDEIPTGVNPYMNRRLAWSPDGTTLAASMGYSIVLWDAVTGRKAATLSKADELIAQADLSFSPDGSILASNVAHDVHLWRIADGTLIGALPATSLPPPPPVPTAVPGIAGTQQPPPTTLPDDDPRRYLSYPGLRGIAWWPDNNVLFTDWSYAMILWDAKTGEVRRTIPYGNNNSSWSSIITLAGGHIVGLLTSGPQSRGTIRLWNADTGEPVSNKLPDGASSIAGSPDGQALAVSTQNEVTIWGIGAELPPTTPTAKPVEPTRSTPVPAANTQTKPACGAWTVVDSPNVDVTNELRGVAAISNEDVWAVGYHSIGPNGYVNGKPIPDRKMTLTLHWDGTRWKPIPSPNVEGGNNYLTGVTAVSNKETGQAEVWAVGYYTTTTDLAQPLIIHWDGASWSRIPTPKLNTNNNPLNAVTALSNKETGQVEVWAVGSYRDGIDYNDLYNSKPMPPSQTLILHWDGKAWIQVASPSPGKYANHLISVAASASDDVWAVGDQAIGGGGSDMYVLQPLVLRWDGSTWSAVPVPDSANSVSGVAAISKDNAWIVGGSNTEGSSEARILRWDGSRWRAANYPSPQLPQDAQPQNVLGAITAISAKSAWALGFYTNDSAQTAQGQTWALYWDGAVWSRISAPRLQLPGDANLDGYNDVAAIAATATGDVWAVGTLNSQGQQSKTLIMRYTGAPCSVAPTAGLDNTPSPTPTLSLSPSPALTTPNPPKEATPPPSPPTTYVYPSPTPVPDCGLVWSVVPISSTGNLLGVAALSPEDVWAVGYTFDTPRRTLIEHWDGAQWSVVPSPSVGEGDNMLNGLVAISSEDMWAVGQYGAKPGRTLTMHWNGKTWRVVSSPDPQADQSVLTAVAAVSPSNVWAVGYYYPRGATSSSGAQSSGASQSHTLIEHWDGRNWTIVASPSPSQQDALSSLGVVSANDIWAVGNSATCDQYWCTSRSLLLRWNGKVWSRYTGPIPSDNGLSLSGLAVLSANDIWASGAIWTGDPDGSDIVLHWDGKSWTQALSSFGGTNGGFSAIAALSGQDVWAVGGGFDPSNRHWDGSSWSWQPVVSADPNAVYRGGVGGLHAIAALSPTDVWAVGGFDFNNGNNGKDKGALVLRYGNVPCRDR